MTHVMIDLETLGTKPGSVILSIGAVVFDPGYKAQTTGQKFHRVIDRASQTELGLTIDPDTQAWWGRQSEAARRLLAASGDPLDVVLADFSNWLDRVAPTGSKNVRLWGNGSDFDNVLLSCAYSALGVPPPWKFYNNRCYRTLKNMCADLGIDTELKRTGVYHCAVDDAESQANHAIELLTELHHAQCLLNGARQERKG